MIVVLTPLSFRLIGEVYRGIYPALAETPIALALVRFLLAILALAPATVLMGATLPTLTRFLSTGQHGIGKAFQQLYAANTVGAIVGTAIAGFALIEILGLTGRALSARRARVSPASTALILDGRPVAAGCRPSRSRPSSSPRPRGTGRRVRGRPSSPRSRRATGSPRAHAGVPVRLTSLGYQVVWNRLLGAGTGNRPMCSRSSWSCS